MKERDTKMRLPGEEGKRRSFEDGKEKGNGAEKSGAKQNCASTGRIILFPDFDELRAEIEKLRTELSMLLLERDELQLVICKNIEAAYMLEFGGLEYQMYEARCLALRLKRKIELIQAKKNRQEKIYISEIEKLLDREFDEYQKRLDDLIGKMNEALERRTWAVLTEEDAREIKRLYRKVVKMLHPDLNPDLSEAQVHLFYHAVEAYQRGDLAALRVIGEMVGVDLSPEHDADGRSQLGEERNRLRALLQKVNESIAEIKANYPYTMKEVLEDPKRLEQKKKELEQMLRLFREQIAVYQAKIEEMLQESEPC